MLTGISIIGSERGSDTSTTFHAFNPQTGEAVGPDFHSATLDELSRAADLAEAARIPYGNVGASERASFLRAVAQNM